jgi:hypothetical protein
MKPCLRSAVISTTREVSIFTASCHNPRQFPPTGRSRKWQPSEELGAVVARRRLPAKKICRSTAVILMAASVRFPGNLSGSEYKEALEPRVR